MYESALKLLKEIEKNGFKVYIVGGYPRDKYLNKKSTDIDICTNAKVEDLEKLFKNINTKYKNYGNCIINIDGYSFEVTTFRKEKYLKNRNDLKIEFIDKLKKDLKRRDFTINTLCIDSNGNYIDLMHARYDMDKKIIKLIGKIERLKDDPLRILRAIRFATNYNLKLDDYLIKGIKKYSYLLKNVSQNKINEELIKMNNLELIKKYKLNKYIEK